MAFIPYYPEDTLTEAERISDRDNIIQIHRAHPAVMRHHYDLYIALMRKPGPLSRVQRELMAVVISALNNCHY
jgi:hypothetical protein